MATRPLRPVHSRRILFASLLLFLSSASADPANNFSLASESGETVPAPTPSIFPEQVYTIGGTPLSTATGDFNGDRLKDVAVANYGVYHRGGYLNGDVSVLLGYGNGTLAPQIRLTAGNHPRTVVASDFNSDSFLCGWPGAETPVKQMSNGRSTNLARRGAGRSRAL